MITRYSDFLAENVQRSKAIIAQRMKDYEGLKERLTRDNTLGYLGKLTELLFRDEPVTDIMAAYDRLMALRRANVRLDIESVRTLEQLQDLIETKEIDLQVAQVMSKFPPTQKRMFHPVTMTRQDRVLLASMSKVDTTPFMRKVSQYRDKATLVDNAKRFMKSVSTPADKEHFMGLAGGGLRLVHEDDRLLIFKTDTVADLLKVAADAAWCIKSPSTFKRYTSNGATQYVLIDYDKGRWDPMFKIGFTVATNGTITHAHDVLDRSVISQVRELLAAQAVSVKALVGDSSKRPKLPRKDVALGTIIRWVDENGVLPDEARELLRMVSDKMTLRDLETWSTKSMLGKLLVAVSPERMITAEDLDGLLPGPVVSAIKRNYKSQFEDVVLFDLRSKKIKDLTDTRVLPHLDAITHDVFNNVALTEAVKTVSSMVRSQVTRMARPDIADCVRRLVSLHDTVGNKERAQVLMAAVDHAETGRPPEYNTIDPLLKELTIAWYDRIAILVDLGVRVPFDEKYALLSLNLNSDLRDQYMSLTDFGRGVTLKDVSSNFSSHKKLFSRLVGAGIEVTVETTEESVTRLLEYYAVWTTATGQYRQSSNDGLPEWIEDPQLRRVIIRPRSRRQGRFAFAPGTEFPVTYSQPGRYTVTIKKGNIK